MSCARAAGQRIPLGPIRIRFCPASTIDNVYRLILLTIGTLRVEAIPTKFSVRNFHPANIGLLHERESSGVKRCCECADTLHQPPLRLVLLNRIAKLIKKISNRLKFLITKKCFKQSAFKLDTFHEVVFCFANLLSRH